MIFPAYTHSDAAGSIREIASLRQCKKQAFPKRDFETLDEEESATTRKGMPKVNLFLDSSALFAGSFPLPVRRVLLLLAETGHITVTISEQVVTETERIARKVPRP
jgi:hypothetical protein